MDELSVAKLTITLFGGLLAGVINTLAGNGSAVTLTILTEVLGLPGTLANGTNRIGIALQTLTSTFTFRREGVFSFRKHLKPIIITFSGAVVGLSLALLVSDESFMRIFRFLMVAMLLVLLVKPSRWIYPHKEGRPWPKPILWTSLFFLGIYGGFIQMGMGIFFLALIVLGAKYSLLEANALKVAVVGVYTLLGLVLFQSQGLIHWQYGLMLGLGQTLGGWGTARFASRYEKINILVYWFLVLIVILSLLSLFDILQI